MTGETGAYEKALSFIRSDCALNGTCLVLFLKAARALKEKKMLNIFFRDAVVQ